MQIKLLHDTLVKFQKDVILEVPEEEARRLIAFKNAVEEKSAPKKAVKAKKIKGGCNV